MNTQLFSILLLLVIAVLGFSLYIFMQRRKNPSARHNKPRTYASAKAVRILRRFSTSNGYHFLADVQLENGTQLSGLCIGEFGLLGIKTYGYNGHIYGNIADKNWLRVGYEDTREYFPNPIPEANQDIQSLRKMLQKTKAYNSPIEIVAVFTNASAEMAVEKKSGILQTKDLKALLNRDKYQKQNGVDQDLVISILQGS